MKEILNYGMLSGRVFPQVVETAAPSAPHSEPDEEQPDSLTPY
jgi:hypothetical protein